MTETQAKSGPAGAPANPVDEEDAGSATTPAGRAAVGRAAVPTDAPSPKYTRAPGMPPPPDKPLDDSGDLPAQSTEAVDVSATPVATAAAPVPKAGEPAKSTAAPVVAAAAAPLDPTARLGGSPASGGGPASGGSPASGGGPASGGS